jgi:hypothetical protein
MSHAGEMSSQSRGIDSIRQIARGSRFESNIGRWDPAVTCVTRHNRACHEPELRQEPHEQKRIRSDE